MNQLFIFLFTCFFCRAYLYFFKPNYYECLIVNNFTDVNHNKKMSPPPPKKNEFGFSKKRLIERIISREGKKKLSMLRKLCKRLRQGLGKRRFLYRRNKQRKNHWGVGGHRAAWPSGVDLRPASAWRAVEKGLPADSARVAGVHSSQLPFDEEGMLHQSLVNKHFVLLVIGTSSSRMAIWRVGPIDSCFPPSRLCTLGARVQPP